MKNGNILFVAPLKKEEGRTERNITLDVLVDDYLSAILTGSTSVADHVIELKLGGSTAEDEAHDG